MSILSTCQSAGVLLVGRRLTTLFSTTDQLAMELIEIANEAATDIAKKHDWRALTKVFNMTGDGASTSFPLPSDYDRMPEKATIITNWLSTSLAMVKDLDQWLYFQSRPNIGVPGYWILLNNAIQIQPPFPNGNTASFYYLTNQIVSGNKTSFTVDADTFLLPERLLKLAIIWRWRQLKRLEYSEDMSNFEIALSEEISRERGPRVVEVGRSRLKGDSAPYPGVLGGGSPPTSDYLEVE